MKATVTLYRYYYKKVVIPVNQEEIEGLTKEEIGEKFQRESFGMTDDAIQDQPLIGMDCTGNNESDRYDIYDDDNKHIYGGHL